MPDDPTVASAWTVAVVAEKFGVLPTVVAQDLEDDPTRFSLLCAKLLQYAEAKSAFDRSEDPDDLKVWQGTSVMRHVKKNFFDLAAERKAKRLAEEHGANGS